MTPVRNTTSTIHYDIELEILPDTRFISVQGSLVFDPSGVDRDKISLLLHRQFEILAINSAQVTRYEVRREWQSPIPYIPEAGTIVFEIGAARTQGERIVVQFAYQGQITHWPEYSCNVISPDWVELGQYLPWYPFYWDFAPSVTSHLRVHCPPDYQVAGYGEFRLIGDVWECNWDYPSQDIVVVCSPQLRRDHVEGGGYQVNVYSNNLQPETSRFLGEDALRSLAHLSDWFGPILPPSFNIIVSPRNQGGGYGRRGLVVLGGLDEQDFLARHEAYLRYLAHEIAHGWWWAASVDTWEDWLNESFAEMSALLVIEAFYGVDAYHRQMEQKRLNSIGAGPIWGFNRFDQGTSEKREQCEIILYEKGPVCLHDLRERIGKEDFLLLCKCLRESHRTTTESFLDLIEIHHGFMHRTWFQEKLQTY